MLTFPLPDPFNGSSLAEVLGITPFDLFVSGGTLSVDLPESERDRVAAAVASHAGEAPELQLREERVQQKIDAAIAQIRNELANWPADLPNNANASTIVGRVNQMAAQLRRTTERTEKLAQLARGLFDVPEV